MENKILAANNRNKLISHLLVAHNLFIKITKLFHNKDKDEVIEIWKAKKRLTRPPGTVAK
jgi:hypothetical protein